MFMLNRQRMVKGRRKMVWRGVWKELFMCILAIKPNYQTKLKYYITKFQQLKKKTIFPL